MSGCSLPEVETTYIETIDVKTSRMRRVNDMANLRDKQGINKDRGPAIQRGQGCVCDVSSYQINDKTVQNGFNQDRISHAKHKPTAPTTNPCYLTDRIGGSSGLRGG